MRKNILIICGGISTEHEISIMSARNVVNAIDTIKYKPVVAIISKSGTWYHLHDALCAIDSCNDEALPENQICSLLNKFGTTFLNTLGGDQTKIDCAMPLMHGQMGEDGAIQGMLETLNLPYVGSGILSSALTFDKELLKRLLDKEGIPVTPFIPIYKKNEYLNYESASKKLDSNTLFVKSAQMGSSIGVSKVTNSKEYDTAINNAFMFSNKVLVELPILGHEVECAVLGNENPIASPIGEIKTEYEFYSYEAKYIQPERTQLLIPASLSNELSDKVKAISIAAYKIAGCRGMARVDSLISYDNTVYINEINAIPGFTNISMYPKLFIEHGISYSDLITKLIDYAFEEYSNRQSILHSFKLET